MIATTDRSPRQRSRGYLLIELVTVVALLGVFTVIIGATFSAAYRGQVDAIRREDRDHAVDAAMAILRRDIWNAHAIAAANEVVTFTDNAGATIHWTWDSPWTRTVENGGGKPAAPEGSSTMRFPGLPTENIAADVHGPSLTLHFGGKATPSESITFISQSSLGGPP